MDILSQGTWWAFLLIGIVVFMFQRFYKPFQEVRKPNWELIIYVVKLILVLIVFFVYGWKGGVAVMVALYLFENIFGIIMSLLSAKKGVER